MVVVVVVVVGSHWSFTGWCKAYDSLDLKKAPKNVMYTVVIGREESEKHMDPMAELGELKRLPGR